MGPRWRSTPRTAGAVAESIRHEFARRGLTPPHWTPDALARSAAAFAMTVEVDPTFVRGLVDLANTALKQRVNIKLDVALEAFRRAVYSRV